MRSSKNSAGRRRHFLRGGVFLLLGVPVLIGLTKAVLDPGNAPVFPHVQITIQRADGKVFPFNVEVATTEEQQRYGLMHRASLPADGGMLFLFEEIRVETMWMKDTPLSLDMLFVRGDGTIDKIITHTVPFDVTPIYADQPVKAVIEVKAGTVTRLNLKTGDRVIYSAFSSQ